MAGAELRCFGGDDPLYRVYHDEEWGRPVRDERGLFERISLEAFQSGLAWITILRKRDNFRAAFAGFDIEAVAAFGEEDVARLMADVGIVRNRLKIEAAINNARAAREVGLAELIWAHAPDPLPPRPRHRGEGQATTSESVALAKALKKAGFRFVGPTTAYATMQACGLVDDHFEGCHVPAPDRRR
jgi:DNA-3-methyladenine glycosylase I